MIGFAYGVMAIENGAPYGIAFSVAQAAELFSNYAGLQLVLCVDAPRCEFVRCIAHAANFFDGGTNGEASRVSS